MKKESFIIYTRFYKPIQKLKDEQLGRLFRALFLYNSTDGDVPVGEDIETAFGFFTNQMDIDNAKWMEKVEKLRANARAGKRKQMVANGSKCNQIGLDNVNVNVNVNAKEKNIEKKVASAPVPRFVKPSAMEVSAYAVQMGYIGFNVEAFCSYYESNGWKVGRNPMKDWKAAVRSWHSKDKPKKADSIHNVGTATDFEKEAMYDTF